MAARACYIVDVYKNTCNNESIDGKLKSERLSDTIYFFLVDLEWCVLIIIKTGF